MCLGSPTKFAQQGCRNKDPKPRHKQRVQLDSAKTAKHGQKHSINSG